MKRFILGFALLSLSAFSAVGQGKNIQFSEYDLPNGLHVILYKDSRTPIVSVSVMYHVGSKNEDPTRTGFAHFFEHLLFEGTENIERAEYMKLVQGNGGVLNANTSHDRTYYFEVLPSNQLELGLWMESERMLHAKVDSAGIETQRKVVKEEKKQSYDNRPYGQMLNTMFENAYTVHPYKWMPIGKEQYIDEAKYSEFMDFYKTFYVPNNAVLVVAGDFDEQKAKDWITKYYGDIPKGTRPIPRPNVKEPEQTKGKRVTFHDPLINLPAVVLGYHAPALNSDDYYALQMLNALLSRGKSSRFQKQIVDKDQRAVGVGAFALDTEDPGLVIMYGIAAPGTSADVLEKAMNSEVEKAKKNLVTDEEFRKLQNQMENAVVSSRESVSGIAENLATSYAYFKNTALVNEELDRYMKITKEDLKRVANKYLTKENSVVLHYMPEK